MASKTILLILVASAAIGVIIYLEANKPRRRPGTDAAIPASRQSSADNAEKAKRFPRAVELVAPSGFINTEPLTIESLVGKKIIMVDFWTYSCINCQRTTPYLNAWYEKYKDRGLEIIGVHTPEFAFEKESANVKAAVEKFGIKYPVVQDNAYGTWSAYGNRYWPRKYLIDIDGYIVYDHIGEGGYEETESKIQELLDEKMQRDQLAGTPPLPVGFVQPGGIDIGRAASPEIYFGSARNAYLANGKRRETGAQTLSEPASVLTNDLYLTGTWQFSPEYAENTSKQAKITFRYNAEDVYFVARGDRGVKVRVTRDGKPLNTAEAGEDVEIDAGGSYIVVQEDRLYKVLHEPAGPSDHTLEMIIESPGLQAFTFTFG